MPFCGVKGGCGSHTETQRRSSGFIETPRPRTETGTYLAAVVGGSGISDELHGYRLGQRLMLHEQCPSFTMEIECEFALWAPSREKMGNIVGEQLVPAQICTRDLHASCAGPGFIFPIFFLRCMLSPTTSSPLEKSNERGSNVGALQRRQVGVHFGRLIGPASH